MPRDYRFPLQPVRYIRVTSYYVAAMGGADGSILWSVQAFTNPPPHVQYFPLRPDGKYFAVNIARPSASSVHPIASVAYANCAAQFSQPAFQDPAAVLDGDDNSFIWITSGGANPNATATLTVDLGQVESLGGLSQVYGGGGAPVSYSVRVAQTLGSWTQVIADTPITPVPGNNFTASFAATQARYLELTMKGTPASSFVNFLELMIFPSSLSDPAPSSTSQLDLTYLTGMSLTGDANMQKVGDAHTHAFGLGYGYAGKTAANGATGDGAITLDLGQQYQVSEVVLEFLSTQTWAGGGKVDVDDGSGNWVTVLDTGRGVNLGPTAGGPQTITFATRTVRSVRVTSYFVAGVGAGQAVIENIEVY